MDNVYKKIFRFIGGGASGLNVLNAKAADGFGAEIDVSQWIHIGVEIASDNNFDGAVKCQGSFQSLENVDFSAVASLTNRWFYVAMYKTIDALILAGGTGVVFSGTDSVQGLLINHDNIRSINFQVTDYVIGDVTVTIFPTNNQ